MNPGGVAVLFNPSAKGEGAGALARRIPQLRGKAHFIPTLGPGSAGWQARQAVEAGAAVIVAAGGDGTLNEVVNGLAQAPSLLGRVSVGLLPLGTANVFALEHRIPRDLEGAWDCLLAGRVSRIDLPWLDYGPERGGRRWFCQLAGAGLDAAAIRRVRWEAKKSLGKLSYLLAGFEALAGTLPPVEARVGDQVASGPLVLLGNGRFYGGSFPIFPKADPRDGLLDVLVFDRAALSSLPGLGLDLLLGGWPREGFIRQWQTRELTLSAPPGTWSEVDGELAGELGATAGVDPLALSVILP